MVLGDNESCKAGLGIRIVLDGLILTHFKMCYSHH